jgi:hypothetical protein
VVVPATELPGTSTIDVFAEDLATHRTYTFNFTVQVGINDISTSDVNIYPNPNNGQFIINGIEDASVDVYSITGKIITKQLSTNGFINIENISNGVYFIKITTEEGIVTKRFTVSK